MTTKTLQAAILTNKGIEDIAALEIKEKLGTKVEKSIKTKENMVTFEVEDGPKGPQAKDVNPA